MTELQRTLKLVERSLCQIPTTGAATLHMAEALMLLVRAQGIETEREAKQAKECAREDAGDTQNIDCDTLEEADDGQAD